MQSQFDRQSVQTIANVAAPEAQLAAICRTAERADSRAPTNPDGADWPDCNRPRQLIWRNTNRHRRPSHSEPKRNRTSERVGETGRPPSG